MIRTATLGSGLQIVTEAMDSVESIALSFWVGTGSRDETDAQAGMSHFLEHLLFKGSKTRSALQIAQAIDETGGDMNAFTTKENTSFYVRVLAEDTEVALDILCDIMCDPAFDGKEIEAERQVVLEEILMRNDEPSELVVDQWSNVMFAGHALGRDILGSEEHIEEMKRADIQTFFEHHYRPNNMVFAAAGKLNHDEVVAGVDKRMHRTGGQRPRRVAPVPNAKVHSIFETDTDQVHLVLGVPAPDRHDDARYAMSILDQILGGGMSSRLFQEVREKAGLAYTVYSSYAAYEDTGEMTMYVGTAPKRAQQAADIVCAEVLRIAREGVGADELERAKRSLRATSLMNLEDVTARMSRIGRSLLLHGDVLAVDEVQARLDAVTQDHVRRLASDVFSKQPVSVALGPIEELNITWR